MHDLTQNLTPSALRATALVQEARLLRNPTNPELDGFAWDKILATECESSVQTRLSFIHHLSAFRTYVLLRTGELSTLAQRRHIRQMELKYGRGYREQEIYYQCLRRLTMRSTPTTPFP